jgi:hypothetical protein
MPRTWPSLTAVALVGLLAGAAIAGRPVAKDPFVITPEQIPTTTLLPAPTSDSTTSTPAAASSMVETTVETAVGEDNQRVAVRVVLVDVSGVSGTIDAARASLQDLGYASVATAQGGDAIAVSQIYYREGFEPNATTLAADLGVPDAAVSLLTDEVLSPVDDQGDIIVLLGADVGA